MRGKLTVKVVEHQPGLLNLSTFLCVSVPLVLSSSSSSSFLHSSLCFRLRRRFLVCVCVCVCGERERQANKSVDHYFLRPEHLKIPPTSLPPYPTRGAWPSASLANLLFFLSAFRPTLGDSRGDAPPENGYTCMQGGREGKLEGEEGREGERERRRRGKEGKGGSVKKNIQAHDIHTHVCTTMPTITCRFHTT